MKVVNLTGYTVVGGSDSNVVLMGLYREDFRMYS